MSSDVRQDQSSGQFKRFSGEQLDGKELKRWKLWAQAKMASTKDLGSKQRGPWVFTLLDGLALETVEHLTLEQLSEEGGDEHIWKALSERFPEKLQHDLLAECLSEVFALCAREGETMAVWCSRVQETFSKCRRKVNVSFPEEARGWIALRQSGLSSDQQAVVTARSSGELKFDTIASSLRSCFPEFQVGRSKKSTSAMLVQEHEEEEEDQVDNVVFQEVEALLADYGVSETEPQDQEVFDEAEAIEILAASWKEKRTEINKLQKSRNFRQIPALQRQLQRDVSEVKKRSKCWKCGQVGHFSRDCKSKGSGKGSSFAKSSHSGSGDKSSASGAAMVEEETITGEDLFPPVSEVLLVSSPGYGVIDSGCGKTLIGQDTLNTVFRLLQEKGQTIPTLRKERHLFRFGNQNEEMSEYAVKIPIGIGGRIGHVDASVIAGSAPLLLSRNTMRSLGAVLNFDKETLALAGSRPQKLCTNGAGQFIINVMEFSPTENSQPKPEPNAGDSRLTKKEARHIESLAAAWSKGKSNCVVAELFSPPRFTLEVEKLGKKGLAYDLKTGYNLLNPKVQRQVEEELDRECPELLVCCPECKHWGGWYRLNEHKLPTWKRIWNRRMAEKQVDFCIAQAKRQIKRGGRVLFEHPWPSGVWRYPPMAKLLKLMHLCKASMCAYGLRSPDSDLPIQKSTGLAVSHDDMKDLVKQCSGDHVHEIIAGKLSNGTSLSEWTAAYTQEFCQNWLQCTTAFHSCMLCEHPTVQDGFTTHSCVTSEGGNEVFAAEEATPEQIRQSLRKLHNNLGHPTNEDLVRVLHNAGGSREAITLAKSFHCEVCVQRQRPTPALPVSAHQILDFGHRVGIDVKNLPGWNQNQQVKCLNIIDYGSSFQFMCPFYCPETGPVLRELFEEKWLSWAGRPVEVILDPAKTNLSEAFAGALEAKGIRVISTAAEAHNQLGKVEKHGHLFETILEKVLDQVRPVNKEEYHQCIRATINSKNESLNHHGLSPCQHVFGRNPRVPEDLVQENPCPVAATGPMHDPAFARSHNIRTAARVSMAQAQDSTTLRTALNARPRKEREFLAGDFVAYWRTQKYEKGARLVGGRWYGTAIVMGKVGRNILVYHRRNMFKVSPEHLRHATIEERAVAQSDGREMLGLAKYVGEQGQLQGSQYIDLTNQASVPVPQVSPTEASRESPAPRTAVAAPTPAGAPSVPVERESSTRSDDPVPAAPITSSRRVEFDLDDANAESPAAGSSRDRNSPYPNNPGSLSQSPSSPNYGPVLRRYRSKLPQDLVRPPGTIIQDFHEAREEIASHKRLSSRDLSNEPPQKVSRQEGDQDIDETLVVDSFACAEDEVLSVTEQQGGSVEVFLANFLKKKAATELHHSNNPPELQAGIDEAKVIEWSTLHDEKQAMIMIPPHVARKVRQQKGDRIMSSRFVITQKVEDSESRLKARWCLRGHHDPDLLEKVASGRCHSPTLAQLSRNILLQIIVSHRWDMKLGDIKGAFLEADVKDQMLSNPVYAELPPGGVPGIEPGSLVQIVGNIYGANDAPHNWYVEFDKVALESGFTRSKFDSCLYLCHNSEGILEGILGAHVDDTITGGGGPKYSAAIAILRSRFPFRKWREGSGEFLGTMYHQCPKTKVISYQQCEYARHIQPIKVSRDRLRTPWKLATPQEMAALRAVNGALGWLSSQSRPDLAVQTSLSQQVFPQPTVKDIIQANQAIRRARQHADMTITVPYISPEKLTVVFWSDAAFANLLNHRTQGGWLVGLTDKSMSSGEDVPLSCIGWKSYKLPRVVSSTLGGQAQSFSSASGIAEWSLLILAEALDGPFDLRHVDIILHRRPPIGITDCRSLYDHLISLGTGGTLDDKRTAIDVAVIRQSIARCKLEPRWCPTDHMAADGLTKDKGEPLDLLRSIIRSARYQLADEQLVLDRKREERDRRREVGVKRAIQAFEQATSHPSQQP